MSLSTKRKGLLYAILLVVDVAIIGFVVAWFAGWFPHQIDAESRHLAYGQAVPNLTVKDINGTPIKLQPEARISRLLFFTDPNHEPSAEEKYGVDYINILRNRYNNRLNALAILSGKAEVASKYVTSVNFQFPIVADPDRSLSRRLTVHDGATAVILTDGQGIVRYSEFHDYPSRDLLRQLVEKHVVGQVHTKLPDVQSSLLYPGQRLPMLMVQDVLTKEPMTLEPEALANYILFLFNADCSSCQFVRYLRWVNDVRMQESAKGNVVVALVTRGFYRDKEVGEQISSWTGPLWLIENPFEGLEDPYNPRHDMSDAPMVIKLGGDGIILSTEPFLIARQTGQ